MRAAGSRPGPPATRRGRTPQLSAPQGLVDRRLAPARSWPAPETPHGCSALPGRSTGSSLRSHASWWLSVLECAPDPPLRAATRGGCGRLRRAARGDLWPATHVAGTAEGRPILHDRFL